MEVNSASSIHPLRIDHQINRGTSLAENILSPPGFETYAQATSATTNEAPYSMEQLAMLFTLLDRQTRACRSSNEQVAVMMRFYYHHRSILTPNA